MVPESKREEARERYREDEEACRTIFEGIGVEQVEQKQLIRLGKREENKTRPVLVKLGKEKNAREVPMKAKDLETLSCTPEYLSQKTKVKKKGRKRRT